MVLMSAKLKWDEFKDRFDKRGLENIKLVDIGKEEYGGSHSLIEAECVKHGRFKIESRRLITAMFGCDACAREYRNNLHRKTTEEFIRDSKKIFGDDKFDYANVIYHNSKTKVDLICKVHGVFKVRPSDHLSKLEGCPKCRKQSKLESIVSTELIRRNVLYIQQKRFDWLGKMSLDFYIPSLNVGIECQGKQHFLLGGWSKGFDFANQIKRDKIKKKLCDSNGISLVYFTDVKKINFDMFDGIYCKDNTFTSIDEMINKTLTC